MIRPQLLILHFMSHASLAITRPQLLTLPLWWMIKTLCGILINSYQTIYYFDSILFDLFLMQLGLNFFFGYLFQNLAWDDVCVAWDDVRVAWDDVLVAHPSPLLFVIISHLLIIFTPLVAHPSPSVRHLAPSWDDDSPSAPHLTHYSLDHAFYLFKSSFI